MSSQEKTIAGIILVVLILGCCVWGPLTKEGRVAKRANTEQTNEPQNESPSATKPHTANPFASSELIYDAVRANVGKAVFEEVMNRYPELSDFYRVVDRRGVSLGFGAFIHIPSEAWSKLNETQREDLGHFMSRESPINGWAIYIGAIDGDDVTQDSTAFSSNEWELRK